MASNRSWVCAGLLCALVAGCGDSGTATSTTGPATAPKPVADTRPGTLQVTLTYFITKSTPAKPDDGALVMLVPQGAKGPIGQLSYMDQPKADTDLKNLGGYFLKLNQSGSGKIDNIFPGTYTLFMVSMHSWANEAQHEAAVAALRPLVSDWNAIGNREIHIQSIEILPAKAAEISSVFGE